MSRSRSWFGGIVSWNRPKEQFSLENLKRLHNILEKNATVTESNRSLIVETLREIAQQLIWGDQHDSSMIDFFLEKNMLSYFLQIMRQRSGGSHYVCVQLLQLLNILFENIKNNTSLYYLLSNNHVNSIIVHKFDFSDEDVMGYYILFLKTLSLKLNTNTIHFFFNEQTNDFPLYTEAIKFFNHQESMVRIAVRTISLNVYRVRNDSMLRFIRDKTAAPYFSNLVWFIGGHILELDACVRNDIDHQSNQKLENLVAEHLDHLHYLNDILLLEIKDLNDVLTEHLMHKLFVPLYIFSLTPAPPPSSLAVVTQNLAAVLKRNVNIDIPEINNPRVSSIVALYLLSLVFLVITHAPLVHALAWVILHGDQTVFEKGADEVLNCYVEHREVVVPSFGEPRESLEEALDTVVNTNNSSASDTASSSRNASPPPPPKSPPPTVSSATAAIAIEIEDAAVAMEATDINGMTASQTQLANVTDEEKEKLQQLSNVVTSTSQSVPDGGHPFLDTVLTALDCGENDYLALLALCLTYAMAYNKGLKNEWFQKTLLESSRGSRNYKTELIERLLKIILHSNQPSCRIRLVSLEITLELLLSFTKPNCDNAACISESQQEQLFLARDQSMGVLRNFYKSEDIFLDLFEDEFNEMRKNQLNVEYLCLDSTILLPPTRTPLTGIRFTRRLPCGEEERARRGIRVFFLLRRTCQKFLNEKETILPLTNVNLVQVDKVLDLNNSDLIACTVITKDGTKQRRFLVIDLLQLILVEPDAKLLGWGVAKFVGFLQDVEVVGDKDDSRCLHITVHRGGATHNRTPLLSAKFLFDDHIRCMAAKQRLTKGRSKARQKKMYQIAQLIEMSGQAVDSPVYAVSGMRGSSSVGEGIMTSSGGRVGNRDHRPILSTANRFPGVAAALRRDGSANGGVSRTQMAQNRSIEGIRNESTTRPNRRRHSNTSSNSSTSRSRGDVNSSSSGRENSPSSSKGSMQSRENSQHRTTTSSTSRSRENSPRMPRPRSEEIPLEDFQHSRNSSPHSSRGGGTSSTVGSRAHTPSRLYQLNNAEQVPSTLSASPREAPPLLCQINGVVPIAKEVIPAPSSEETSFIGCERRKGAIETV